MKKILSILFFLTTAGSFAQWDTLGKAGFSAWEAMTTFIAVNPTTKEPYVVYKDIHNYSKATVMRFDGSNWVTVGQPGFSEGVTDCTTLAFGPNGETYVAFMDGAHGNKATVMKFDAGVWNLVGNAGISDGFASFESIDVDKNGVPYVAFRDSFNKYGVSVMKFTGTKWEYVGEKGFSEPTQTFGGPMFLFLTLDKNGLPHVAYQDITNNFKLTVQRFNGNSWEMVGTPGFANSTAQYSRNLAFDSKNRPYIVCSVNGHITAMRFENEKWTALGNSPSTMGGAEYASITIDKYDTPYIAFQDYGVTRRASVIKFDGSNWSHLGTRGFSPSSVKFTNVAVDNDGSVFVVFGDNNSKPWKATVMKFKEPIKTNSIEIENQRHFDVFPNPTNGILHLGEGNGTLQVFTAIGQLAMESEYAQQIDLSSLPAGIYFLRGNNRTLKIIKE